MRVGIFTDNDFDKVNGVTTTLTAVLRHAPPDVKPRIYTAADLSADAPDYLALRSPGLPIPFYGEMRMYVPRWREYLRRVVDDKVSVLHLTTPGPVGLAALWVAAKTKLPLVGSFHTDLAAYTALLSGSPRLGHWMAEYMRWMYGRCARVLVPSAATRDLLLRTRGRATPMEVWTRGVDAAHFDPGRRSERLRHAWRATDRPVVLYVGRVSREKGLDVLPAFTADLRARGIAHRLVIVGDGPMHRELTAACPDAVFTGTLDRDGVAEAFASADLFVFPSRTDTAGNVVLEAQASGLPVLVSTDGGPRENMIDGETGLAIAASGAAAWADAAGAILSDQRRTASMRAAARQYALTRRWEIALEPLYRAYRELGGRPGVAHAA